MRGGGLGRSSARPKTKNAGEPEPSQAAVKQHPSVEHLLYTSLPHPGVGTPVSRGGPAAPARTRASYPLREFSLGSAAAEPGPVWAAGRCVRLEQVDCPEFEQPRRWPHACSGAREDGAGHAVP